MASRIKKEKEDSKLFFSYHTFMDSNIAFEDINQYCYDQLRKHISILRFYMEGESDPTIRQSFKNVMSAMISRHEVMLNDAMGSRDRYVKVPNISWIAQIRHEVDLM